MTKTEAMQNALGTICVAEIEEDINHYMFSGSTSYYNMTMFTGPDKEIAERVLEKFRHGFVDGTLTEITMLDSTYCVNIEWSCQ